MKWQRPDDRQANPIIDNLDPKVRLALETMAEKWAADQICLCENLECDKIHSQDGEEYDIYVEQRRRLACEVIRHCESPPEQLLRLAFEDRQAATSAWYEITPQFEVKTARGKYRLDFVVGYWPMDEVEIAVGVECDGHEWHDKTPAQAARDKARDRALAGFGFPVLRFAAIEVFNDANKCASEVFEVLQFMWRQTREAGAIFSALTRYKILSHRPEPDSNHPIC